MYFEKPLKQPIKRIHNENPNLKIHIKIRMKEYVMRVSTTICLEKEKKLNRINKNQRKKIPFETMCSMCLKSLELSLKALWSL
jgi:hypothetical protein